jgi:hypothetical protein
MKTVTLTHRPRLIATDFRACVLTLALATAVSLAAAFTLKAGVIATSSTEFSGNQGENGWTYGYRHVPLRALPKTTIPIGISFPSLAARARAIGTAPRSNGPAPDGKLPTARN